MIETVKSVFTEFMKLSYVPSQNKQHYLRDLKIDNYILCRYEETKVSIIYLHTGSMFIIPEPWADIFSSFNVFLGDRLNYLKQAEEVDDIEVMIYIMTSLSVCLDSRLHNIPGQEVLDLLGELSLRSTDSFRDWCKEEFGISLEPMEFISLGYNMKI